MGHSQPPEAHNLCCPAVKQVCCLDDVQPCGRTARAPVSLCWHCLASASVALSAERDREKAKDKYVRSLWKLYSLHNQYVLALKAAEVHHFHHYQQALPSLLQSLHGLQEEEAHIT